MTDTRVFYVTDSVESNEEIFESYQEAVKYYWRLVDDRQELVRLRICEVNNAYFDKQLNTWNYDDLSDTFTTIKELELINA